MRQRLGDIDLVWVTLDTLRLDVAEQALAQRLTPNLAGVLPGGRWEARHTPGNFTLAAHHAFFAGFLPTPIGPHPHPRLFACRFEGSCSIVDQTAVFDTPDVISGLASRGYHTACIGGVGFFNQRTPLGCVLPSYFAERHWSPELSVAAPRSTEAQLHLAEQIAARTEGRLMLFINISAIHEPNRGYLPGCTADGPQSMAAALAYVDQHLPRLFDAFRRRGPTFYIVCADHGTAYGEDGLWGHRLSHPTVCTVPYAEFLLEG
ncbi:MAG TPA: metalloenzyme domain-containing protein [Deltaproteobacteria bacterium]|nr:metalloenzyme domain-containing protein [Deltaproteobacteria bacterium]